MTMPDDLDRRLRRARGPWSGLSEGWDPELTPGMHDLARRQLLDGLRRRRVRKMWRTAGGGGLVAAATAIGLLLTTAGAPSPIESSARDVGRPLHASCVQVRVGHAVPQCSGSFLAAPYAPLAPAVGLPSSANPATASGRPSEGARSVVVARVGEQVAVVLPDPGAHWTVESTNAAAPSATPALVPLRGNTKAVHGRAVFKAFSPGTAVLQAEATVGCPGSSHRDGQCAPVLRRWSALVTVVG